MPVNKQSLQAVIDRLNPQPASYKEALTKKPSQPVSYLSQKPETGVLQSVVSALNPFSAENRAKSELTKQAIKKSSAGGIKSLSSDERQALSDFSFNIGTVGTAPVNKVTKPVVSTIKQEAQNIVKQNVLSREAARKAETGGIAGAARNVLSQIKNKLVDATAPIEDTLALAQKYGKYKVLPSKDINQNIARVLRAPSLAGQFVKDQGLDKLIASVPDDNVLDQYLIAKHARNLESKGIKTGRDLEKDNKILEAFKDEYDGLAQQVNEYSQKLLDYIQDAGLVSKELATKLKSEYPDYVPFERVFSEIEDTGVRTSRAGGVASLGKQTAVRKIKGSEREIESPLVSLLSRTDEAFRQAEINKAAKQLTEYRNLPENPFDLTELKPIKTEIEITNKKGTKYKTTTLKTPSPRPGYDTISFLDNGIKRVFEAPKDIADAAKNLNAQQLGLLGNIIALPTRVMKIGTTGISLPFVAKNLARDQATALINGDIKLAGSVANPINFVKSFLSVIKRDDLWDDMVRDAAGGTSMDIARNQAFATYEKLRAQRGLGSKILYKVTHPSDLFRTIEDIVNVAEQTTRAQQYRGYKQGLLKQGIGDKEATAMAAKAARENTVDFLRKGEWGSVINTVVPYLNANIQGIRTFLRTAKSKPIQTGVKLAALVYSPIVATTLWNLSDEKRRMAYEDIPEYEKEGNFIIIPPNPVKNKDGRWNVIKIPISQEVASLAQIPRYYIEKMNDIDNGNTNQVLKAFLGTVSPLGENQRQIISSLIPQPIKPSVESMINQNLFTGMPIVPKSLEGVEPKEQYKATTSGTVKKLSGYLGFSPLKTENWLRTTFGSITPNVINAVDRVMAAAGQIPKEEIGGKDIIKSILSVFSEASGGQSERYSSQEYESFQQDVATKKIIERRAVEKIYNQIKELNDAGKKEDAVNLINSMSDEQFAVYKSILKTKKINYAQQEKPKIYAKFLEIRDLNESGKKDEAIAIINAMTDDEFKYYKKIVEDYNSLK